MRWPGRLLAAAALALSLVALFYLAALPHNATLGDERRPAATSAAAASDKGCAKEGGVQRIRCDIEDGAAAVDCYREPGTDEVFVPFAAFLKPHFDLDGALDAAAAVFHWRQSYAAVKSADALAGYGPASVFGPFAGYHVERRQQVRCIDARTGVPMSIQWGRTPYYYPIQIAQYGLEHYSKNITEEVEAVDEYSVKPNVWKLSGTGGGQALRYDGGNDTVTLQFPDASASSWAALPLQDCRSAPDVASPARTVLRFAAALAPAAGFALRLTVTAGAHRGEYVLRYEQAGEPLCVRASSADAGDDSAFVYGLGPPPATDQPLGSGAPAVYVRDALTDLNRALAARAFDKRKRKKFVRSAEGNAAVHARDLCIRELHFTGHVSQLGGVRLSSSAHEHMFRAAARWFLDYQGESTGGWPVAARRSLADGRLTLAPGWHSAMAQGHAMSVLCRAYLATADRRYLSAAERAAKLFDVDAKDGGVRNRLFGQFVWYEEYPTVPGSYVLNGFMYSLIGLYDLAKTAEIAGAQTEAGRLFEQGVTSLMALLPLYDLGGRTLYDLRHVGVGPAAAPNVARWDYHALHVLQLRWLAGIVGDGEREKNLNEVADRWHRYAKGERAKHN